MEEGMQERKEFPELDELVICIVKKIIGTSVFLHIENYNKEGVMIFSEVSPGRIRNLRSYVAPNKKIVCKILRIDRKTGHIDLSLRRVSVRDQKEVLNTYNKEKANLIILKLVADENIVEKIKEKYFIITNFFEKFQKDNNLAKKFLKKDQIEKLSKLIIEKEKEKKVKVNLKIKLEHFGSEGIEIIKEILKNNKEKAEVKYISAPLYSLTLEGKNYKEANKKIKEITEKIIQKIKEKGGQGEIIED
jgi:translation initiation factor 2 subunit 1